MPAGRMAFWAVFVLVFVAGTVLVYPGVRRRVPSRMNTLLAASMSAALVGAGLGTAAGMLVNTLVIVFGG